MRIVQLIDSLDAGGAERMAVNYANALVKESDFSGLVVTRKEGSLLNQINDNVSYLFLSKKSSIDFASVFKLRKYIKKNKVSIIHAHSTSFFLAFLLKLSLPSIHLIWHDHYGDSEFLSKRGTTSLRICLPFFKGIIVVNQQLKTWAEEVMHFKNVIYLPNFPTIEKDVQDHTLLFGNQGKRIVSLANLRVQKNHFLLLEVAKKIKKVHPDWTFHLVGKDFNDTYSAQIRALIKEFELEKTVFIYGSKPDVKNILAQANIAVLTSQSEGLPVALLEYGWYKKPVIVTDVGEMPLLVQHGENGFVVPSGNIQLFYESVHELIAIKALQHDFAKAFHEKIRDNYSAESVLKKYRNWLAQNSKK